MLVNSVREREGLQGRVSRERVIKRRWRDACWICKNKTNVSATEAMEGDDLAHQVETIITRWH